jgi:hypothetical protein
MRKASVIPWRRHLHCIAELLQAAISLEWSKGIPLKTTSCLCFHSSQHMRRIREENIVRGMVTGGVVSQRL